MKAATETYRLAILASGSGSNAQRLVEYFHQEQPGLAEVVAILTDNPKAGVLERARQLGVPSEVMPRHVWADGPAMQGALMAHRPNMVLLAGYLRHIPIAVVNYYRGILINIHPSLLPKYGGKGMYGAHVHQAVLAAGEAESGITIHLVDDEYDTGEILAQERIPIPQGWDAQQLQAAIHQLEHQHYPRVVAGLIRKLQRYGH
jgi:phosphoribosylglycinamide formyltransferase 1